MGTKNLVMLKSHIDSINLFFANDFVYENLIWALASMWIFFCNYMVHSMGLILTYIFRSQRKNEKFVSLDSSEQNKSNQFEDYEINEFTEELANLIFPSYGNFYRAKEEREVKTEDSVLVKIDSNIQQDDEKRKGETDCYVLKESNFDVNENGNKIELETKGSIFMHSVSDEVHEDVKKIDENETDCSVFIKGDSNLHQDCKKSVKRVHEEEEKTKGSIFIDSTSKSPLVSQKDIGCFEEEPMTLSFSFLRNVSYSNAFSSTQTIVKKQILENNLEEIHVVQDEEKEEYVEEQRKFPSNKNDCLLYNIGSNKNDDSLRYKIIGSNNSCESLKAFEYLEETQFSYDREVSHGFAKCKNEKKETKEDILEKNEKEFDEMDYDENNEEDEFEWENDEIVEQIKLELRKARQGGLATILEEEEEREYSPNVEEIKPLSIEDKKMEYKDHIVEIQKVYKCYAQKIKKLDVLNYQAMHAIGLLQLKDPLKLILEHKSNDPMMKLINELHRDLELVYVGQICLSWEILCWQHEKIQELKKYDSQWPHRYNLVAGKFQLFQVLLQRFLEDEPFQHGDRIQNYVKNRCVIRNLLQVPSIKEGGKAQGKIEK
ncbi:uncharacterized protein [Cicer arietinum]|uniref:U4/U6.U5 tri-snRNP-associated protein snu66-like isoform X2 n=1 Tax=Cicer arietinum TaxID=3827 RepID=A0A3Q7XVA7_CICAR|nr:U4/U6.U5 tri-snRNP-associated protein snu66-like isoform X2 [Cicer arietinum]